MNERQFARDINATDYKYIGDGVYAFWDGWQMWITANHDPDPLHRVALEPAVMIELADFYRKCREKEFKRSKNAGDTNGDNPS